MAPYVEMAALREFEREIDTTRPREFKGSGARFQNGDTLLARITPCLENGKTAYVRQLDSDEVGWGSTEFIVLSGKADTTDNLFVYYLAISERVRSFVIQSMTGTSGRQRAGVESFDRLVLEVPPLPIQRRIAEILGRLDDKIEVNRRINATLEAMAQTLYRHWFVEFGPFRDGEFVESELGAIPKGWEIRSVYDQAQFVNGASLLKFQPNEERRGLPIIKIAELKAGVTRQTLFTEREMDSKYRIDDGEILFSWSGNPDTSIDVFIWTGGPAWLNQHIFRVLLFQPEEKYLVYYGLKHMLPIFAEIARNKQTTGLGHVTVGDLKSLLVILPSREIIEAFNSVVGPLYTKYYLNLIESRKLTEARDYLLPKLLAGEVEVEAAAEMAS